MVALSVTQPSEALANLADSFLKMKALKDEAKFNKLRNQQLQQELGAFEQDQKMKAALNAAQVSRLDTATARNQLFIDTTNDLKDVTKQIALLELQDKKAGVRSSELDNLEQQRDIFERQLDAHNIKEMTPKEAGVIADEFMVKLGVDKDVAERSRPGFVQQVLDAGTAAATVSTEEARKTTEFAVKLMEGIKRNPAAADTARETFRNNPTMLAAIDQAEGEGQRIAESFLGQRGLKTVDFLGQVLSDAKTEELILGGEITEARRFLGTPDLDEDRERGLQAGLDLKIAERADVRATTVQTESAIKRLLGLQAGQAGTTEPPAGKAKAPPKTVTDRDGVRYTITGKLARDSQGRFFPFANTIDDAIRMISAGEIRPGQDYITGKGDKVTAPGKRVRASGREKIPVRGSQSTATDTTPFDLSAPTGGRGRRRAGRRKTAPGFEKERPF